MFSGKQQETRMDRLVARRVRQEKRKESLQDRMMKAGLYGRGAMATFKMFRFVLLVVPAALGVIASQLGLVKLELGLILGLAAGLAGTLAPSFWLDHLKRSRQQRIRRALPDALDVMVVCLEGGLSLPASFARVARELAPAHPMLALEFRIVDRHTQMGRSTGEAVRDFAIRFDLEELRSMAAVILQAERIGSSVVKAMRVFADTLRVKRQQRAEEMAHKATVKILFPTLLCIFPAILIVILGPAAIQIYDVLINGVLRNLNY
jgi:tight adherence protein C